MRKETRTLIKQSITLAGSPTKLAEHLGVSRQAVWRWENQILEPDAAHIWKLLCLCYRCKMHIIAPKFDEYIRKKDSMDEFR